MAAMSERPDPADPRTAAPTWAAPDAASTTLGGRTPGDRALPGEAAVQPPAPGRGGAATPSFAPPADATPVAPEPPIPLRIGSRLFAWGERTFVMGVVNVTPDSFSGDGLLVPVAGPDGFRADDGSGPRGPAGGPRRSVPADPVAAARAVADRMVSEGADILDVGGESSRPGHARVDAAEEIARVVPVIAAIRAAHPDMPISIDTTKPAVAAAALDAGADMVNDVWGVADDDALSRLAASRGAPIVLMHNRAEARYRAVVAEVVSDLERAIDRAVRAGVAWESIVVDPGFGFGKTPQHNLELLRGLDALRLLRRPILLGTSRKSTLGKVLDLPAEERLEATLATTALGVLAGVDIVRVHDVRENLRAARMADAVARGWHQPGDPTPRAGDPPAHEVPR
jgi:dihydropteroate synthase